MKGFNFWYVYVGIKQVNKSLYQAFIGLQGFKVSAAQRPSKPFDGHLPLATRYEATAGEYPRC